MSWCRAVVVVSMLCGLWAHAATVTAASCSRADVGAAVNQAAPGDEVVIPAGTCAWQTMLRVSKSITLRGASRSGTVLRDDVAKDNPDQTQTFLLAIVDAPRFRLSSLTIEGLALDVNNNNHGHVAIDGASRDVRFDHLTFRSLTNSGLSFSGSVTGVVDHCTFELDFEQGVIVTHDAWDGGGYGDSSWASPSTLGTGDALFIEDCDFADRATNGAGAVVAYAGARLVLRNSVVRSDGVYSMGTDSSGRFRGGRQFEIYRNRFVTSSQFTAIELGTGTGVVFDNSFEGAFASIARLNVWRVGSSSGVFGRCNGSSPYDEFDGGSLLACLDQLGRGSGALMSGDSVPMPRVSPRQTLEPVYFWGNSTDAGVPLLTVVTPTAVRLGREYLEAVPRGGYQPFTYPHPLVLEPDAGADVDAGTDGGSPDGAVVDGGAPAGAASWRVSSCGSSSTGAGGSVLLVWLLVPLIARKARHPGVHLRASWPRT